MTLRCSCKSGPTYHGDFSSGIHRGVTDGFILIVRVRRIICNVSHVACTYIPSSIKCVSSTQIALNQMVTLTVQMNRILLAHN